MSIVLSLFTVQEPLHVPVMTAVAVHLFGSTVYLNAAPLLIASVVVLMVVHVIAPVPSVPHRTSPPPVPLILNFTV